MAMLSKHLTEAVVPPSQRRPDLALPPALDGLVLAAMAKEPDARPPTMEYYGEMIAQVAASLPPDPGTRDRPSQPPPMSVIAPSAAGAVSAIGAVPSQLAPASAYAPAMPAMTPAPYTPPPGPTPTPASMHAPPPAKRSQWWIPVAAVGAVAVVGLIAYGAQHAHQQTTDHRDDASVTPAPGPLPSPPGPQPLPPGPQPVVDDPPCNGPLVGDDDPLFGPPPGDPGPAMMDSKPVADPMPPGVAFETPLGYEGKDDPETHSFDAIDRSTFVAMSLGPMFRGSRDPYVLAQTFAKTYNVRFDGLFQFEAIGKIRCGSWFHGTIKGLPFRIAVVTYTAPAYRVALGIVAPAATAADKKFDDDMKDVARDNVHLP